MTETNPKIRQRTRSRQRDAALKELGFRDYRHYLRSPEWLAVKVRHKEAYGERCGLCDADEGLRQLHHMTYERVGQEHLSDLVLLCVKCHMLVHLLEERGDMGLDFAGLSDFKRAAQYAAEREARLDARPKFDPVDWTEDEWDRAFSAAFVRIKRTLAQISPQRGKEMMEDILDYAKELEACEREGRPYEHAFPESGLDFTQSPNAVIAQLAGRN